MVGLVNVPLILVCVNADAPPVTPPVTTGADQLNVVPTGIIPLVPSVGVIVNSTPLHATVVIAVTDALGLSVTVNWNGAPLPHAAVFGVTVYVALCTLFVGLNNTPLILVVGVRLEAPPVIPPVTIGADQV